MVDAVGHLIEHKLDAAGCLHGFHWLLAVVGKRLFHLAGQWKLYLIALGVEYMHKEAVALTGGGAPLLCRKSPAFVP